MNWFIGHRILREKDGSTLVLYLNQQLTEFAEDILFEPTSNYEEGIEDSAYSYLKENVKGENIKSIKLMLGPLAIAKLSSPTYKLPNHNKIIKKERDVIYHIVKEKDTLLNISNLYNTSVKKIIEHNIINNNKIFLGQKLKIIGNERAKYIVKPQDKIKNISKKMNVTVNFIRYANSIINISPRDKIIIPRKESEDFISVLPHDELDKGSSGQKVKDLQLALYLCGYYVEVDGMFSNGTENVLYKLQAKNNIQPTGVYNLKTKQLITKLILGNQFLVTNPDKHLPNNDTNYRIPYTYVPKNLVLATLPWSDTTPKEKRLVKNEVLLPLRSFVEEITGAQAVLEVVSGYISYASQEHSFINYANTYGLDLAVKNIKKPGESEHQTGLAIDIKLLNKENYSLISLKEAAAKHGFLITYKSKELKNNEIIHMRYVNKQNSQQILKIT